MLGMINSSFDRASPALSQIRAMPRPRPAPNFYGTPYIHPKGEMKQLNQEEEPSGSLKVFNAHSSFPTAQPLQGCDNLGITLEDEDSYITAM